MIRDLCIDRPERRNALDTATISRLRRELAAAADDDETRAVIIFGGGHQAFSAGQDTKELATLDAAARRDAHAAGQALMDDLETHPCLVIAAIEGYCLGGGLELALACDARIASSDATFGLPEVSRDMLPTWGAHHRLARIVGLGRAKELVLLGRRLDATEAVACGLVAERVPAGQTRDRARELAAAATATTSRTTINHAKTLVTLGVTADPRVARYLDALAEGHQS